ncbi:MAG: peroxiredoxin, partial [Candidatus Saccharimonadales bacterium]
DQSGQWHELKDYRGHWLVLYFYPKDDTPGCTAEACSFRDERADISALQNVDVVGVSKDSVASHKRFADKHHLDFTLLSDPEHETISAYGSWKPHKFIGKSFLGTERNTFIISPDGDIAKRYNRVNPSEHAKEIIAELRRLGAVLSNDGE